MTDIINFDAFEQARTHDALEKIFGEKVGSGFDVDELDYFFQCLGTLGSFFEPVNKRLDEDVTNEDVFIGTKTDLHAMIKIAYDLFCLLELWRDRNLQGSNSDIVEIKGNPKLNVICTDENTLRVQYDNVRRVESQDGSEPAKHARKLLFSLSLVNHVKID